jgi:hypothetical protein
MVEVEIECIFCNSKFPTYQFIHSGDLTNIYCSEKCVKEYCAVENIRERKLEIILEN